MRKTIKKKKKKKRPGGFANGLNLKAGDIIIGINGKDIRKYSQREVFEILKNHQITSFTIESEDIFIYHPTY